MAEVGNGLLECSCFLGLAWRLMGWVGFLSFFRSFSLSMNDACVAFRLNKACVLQLVVAE